MLGTNVEAIDHRQVERTIIAWVALSAAVAMAAMLYIFGLRTDLDEIGALAFLSLKLLFTVGTAISASIYLLRLARHGGERKMSIAVVALRLIGIMLLAAASLAFAPITHWNQMTVGNQWLECVLSIPIIAIAPFALIIWTLRKHGTHRPRPHGCACRSCRGRRERRRLRAQLCR